MKIFTHFFVIGVCFWSFVRLELRISRSPNRAYSVSLTHNPVLSRTQATLIAEVSARTNTIMKNF